MKRRDLIAEIENNDCKLIRHGGRHDWYRIYISVIAKRFANERARQK